MWAQSEQQRHYAKHRAQSGSKACPNQLAAAITLISPKANKCIHLLFHANDSDEKWLTAAIVLDRQEQL
jgi:hypothetical protein